MPHGHAAPTYTYAPCLHTLCGTLSTNPACMPRVHTTCPRLPACRTAPQVLWGDLKTRKLGSSLRLEDVTRLDFGYDSEVVSSKVVKQ